MVEREPGERIGRRPVMGRKEVGLRKMPCIVLYSAWRQRFFACVGPVMNGRLGAWDGGCWS